MNNFIYANKIIQIMPAPKGLCVDCPGTICGTMKRVPVMALALCEGMHEGESYSVVRAMIIAENSDELDFAWYPKANNEGFKGLCYVGDTPDYDEDDDFE